jgi:hypothetical protein
MTTTTTTLARPYAARSRRARTVNLVLAREAAQVRVDQARRDAAANASR